MNYQESLEYLYHRLPMYQRVGKAALKPNLDNTIKLLDTLENPYQKFKTVHIAGTNGKGSSAHALAAILQSAGYKTGLYTSPHLTSFTERIKINGTPITTSAVAAFVTKMKANIEAIMPSFFEITVAMAFDYFEQEDIDIAVIEVGLGGRLDSTNVITPEVSLITSIGYDHMDLLGDTLPQIASEKAGIIKENIPVVIGTRQEEVLPVFKNKAEEMQSAITVADEIEVLERSFEHATISYHSDVFQVDIAADYYLRNIPGVIETARVLSSQTLSISEVNIKAGLLRMKQLTGLKGRFQILQTAPVSIADVSHNEDGISALLEQIASFPFDNIHLIYGTVKDKKVESILKLLPQNATYYWTEASVPRALPADEVRLIAANLGLQGESYSNVNIARAAALKNAKDKDLILITGSTFVVAEIEGL